MKIFVIGFNKSGTTSIHDFFQENGIESIHWDHSNLSRAIAKNHKQGNRLLEGYEEWQAFSDLEHPVKGGGYYYSAEKHFQTIDKQYPGSLFILNYRSFDSWANSRRNHGNYLLKAMLGDGLSSWEEVRELWFREYSDHISKASDYFEGKDNFLLLEMDKEAGTKLSEFLERHGFNLSVRDLPVAHRTHKNAVDDQQAVNYALELAKFFEVVDIVKSMKVLEAVHPAVSQLEGVSEAQAHEVSDRLSYYYSVLGKSLAKRKQ
ncbi:sulfotransferase [Marinimicrobium sp. ARAG 43.8]|uniref:sulfotransferase n=1 Tax=Marinimicrobium sp. ARAG 43.8 TaxID=3418719 RepID=UPI003CECE8AE